MERSYLFVPGNQFERIGKALISNADAVIVDLEDSVAISEKHNARIMAEKALNSFNLNGKAVYIRINDMKSSFWEEDLKFVSKYKHFGVLLPKAESPDEIRQVDQFLNEPYKIIPLIETAKGVLEAFNIASASKNVFRLAFGAVDYCLNLGITLSVNELELLFPRSALAVASKAAGIESPIDTVYVDLNNESGLKKETEIALQLGLYAKMCIHPKQVDIVNQVYAISEKDEKWAKEIVVAFEQAELEGTAAISLNGIMIDYPVYKQALSILKKKE